MREGRGSSAVPGKKGCAKSYQWLQLKGRGVHPRKNPNQEMGDSPRGRGKGEGGKFLSIKNNFKEETGGIDIQDQVNNFSLRGIGGLSTEA